MSETDELFDIGENRQAVILPLFPLRLVLFPGQVLPLHIFEPRYRLMVEQCIEGKQPFGVVLMREDIADWRAYQGEVALPYDIGTTAHIHRVERLDDGRYNIVTVGLHRFRVRRLHFDKPYLQGEVEGFPLTADGDRPIYRQLDRVRDLLQRYVDQLAEITDSHIDLEEIPEDPRTLAFVAAGVLQIPWEDKQALLGIADLSALLEAERTVLEREMLLLRHMVATHAQVEAQSFGPSGYLFPN